MSLIRVGPLLFVAASLATVGPNLTAQSPLAWINPATGTASTQPLAPLPTQDREAYYITSAGSLRRVLSTSDFLSADGQSAEERVPTPGRGFLYSALIPGTGQRVLGQERWVAYLAGEVWAWAQYLERRREGRNLQDRYRDLAWLVARRVSSGPRVDGNFEYYESMTKFQASGAYDIDPDELGVQPEPDPETYNGSMWTLARQIFFLDDPDAPVEIGSDQYKKALRYYLSRAYAPELAWNWSNNTLQQAEFSHLIQESDENLRRSTTMVGVILANHLLSSVDALVSGRLLQERSQEPLLELSLLPGPFHRDALVLSIRIPHRLGHGS